MPQTGGKTHLFTTLANPLDPAILPVDPTATAERCTSQVLGNPNGLDGDRALDLAVELEDGSPISVVVFGIDRHR